MVFSIFRQKELYGLALEKDAGGAKLVELINGKEGFKRYVLLKITKNLLSTFQQQLFYLRTSLGEIFPYKPMIAIFFWTSLHPLKA